MLQKNIAYNIVFSDEALKDIDRFDSKVLERIIKKLQWFSQQDRPLDFAKALSYNSIGQYRFRVGDYRVVCDVKNNKVIILRIGHRSSIYR